MNTTPDEFDVAIIGGGAAGLAAAQALGRSRRSVVVIDAGEPRNAPAEGVHNFLTRDGLPPRELLALGRAEAQGYGVRFRDARATATRRTDTGFGIKLDNGQEVVARRIILASGVSDRLPEVEGLAAYWGKNALHCPYCHGWEVQGPGHCRAGQSLRRPPGPDVQAVERSRYPVHRAGPGNSIRSNGKSWKRAASESCHWKSPRCAATART